MGMLRCLATGAVGRIKDILHIERNPPLEIFDTRDYCTWPEYGYCHVDCTVCLPEGWARFETVEVGKYQPGQEYENIKVGERFNFPGSWSVVEARRVSCLSIPYDIVEIAPIPSPNADEIIAFVMDAYTIGNLHGT